MKILVFAHWLEVGGTQVTAIELTAALRDLHGHEVVYFATPGPMLKLVKEKGLRFLPAPAAEFHPSPARMRTLHRLLRRERFDLIWVWDWWQCLDAFYVAHLWWRVPMVVTDMTMNLSRLLPKMLPTTFGTPDLVQQATAAGRRRLELILPPVDMHRNAPAAVDYAPFRAKYGLSEAEITLVMVSRLCNSMKAEGLRRTIEVVRTLGRELPLRLVIVGDGDARASLEQLATITNRELGRPAVVLTGALLDPRPAYAAADIVIGMGGSALRGMAFGKPVIVVGEKGFAAAFTPESADYFYRNGIYGVGNGSSDDERLLQEIRRLTDSPAQLQQLGEFSRRFVLEHFALEAVTARLESFLCASVADLPRVHVAAVDGIRTAAVWIKERRFVPGHWRQRIDMWLPQQFGRLADRWHARLSR